MRDPLNGRRDRGHSQRSYPSRGVHQSQSVSVRPPDVHQVSAKTLCNTITSCTKLMGRSSVKCRETSDRRCAAAGSTLWRQYRGAKISRGAFSRGLDWSPPWKGRVRICCPLTEPTASESAGADRRIWLRTGQGREQAGEIDTRGKMAPIASLTATRELERPSRLAARWSTGCR
jgi:hypothetical protein